MKNDTNLFSIHLRTVHFKMYYYYYFELVLQTFSLKINFVGGYNLMHTNRKFIDLDFVLP